MHRHDLPVLLLILCLMLWSAWKGKLTPAGVLLGGGIALCLYRGGGFTALALLGAFFLLGVGATSWQFRRKTHIGMAQEKSGRRTAGQVWANGGLAGMAGLFAWMNPELSPLMLLVIGGALSSATADTLSSELGTVYGRKFYNIRTGKEDGRGLDGVVSREGTLIGLGGSCVIAGIHAAGTGFGWPALWIVLGGTAGNLADSWLGATLERKNRISNNTVNFGNTIIGAAVAVLLHFLFSFFS